MRQIFKQFFSNISGKMAKNLLEKFRGVVFAPTKFFESVRKEKGFREAFIFVAVVSFLSIALNYLFDRAVYVQLAAVFGVSAEIVALVAFIASVITSFALFGFLHLFVMLLGGRKGFDNTYKAFGYASAPNVLGWVPFVGILFALWSIYLEVKGLSVLHKMSMWRALGALVLGIAGVVILVIIVAFIAAATSTGPPGPPGP